MKFLLKKPIMRKTKNITQWNNGISYLLDNPSEKYKHIFTSDPSYRFIIVRENNMFYQKVYKNINNSWNIVSNYKYSFK